MAEEKLVPAYNCICRDTATGEDSLGFKPYVEAIAEFLTSEGTSGPITLSIEGQWGCGKSSFMKQLMEEIRKKNEPGEDTKYFTVWFNSWKYEKEDELWASFALNFMDKLSEQLSWKRLQLSRLKLFYLRYKLRLKSDFLIIVHFSWSILSFVFIFSFLFLIIAYVLKSLEMPFPNFLNGESIKKVTDIVLILTPLVGLMNYFSTEKWFIDVFRDPFGLKKLESNANYKEHLSFREHFHSDFNEIIKSYVGDSKVYVFIDDLDRCEVPKAAELMQAINLMISDDSKVYFSLGMDRKVISAGLAAKNKQVVEYLDVDGLEYGYDFIEKFIQLPFKVPHPKSTEFLKFLTSLDESEYPSKLSEPVGKSGISEDSIPDKFPHGYVESSLNENSEQEKGTGDSSAVATESNSQEIQNDKDCVEDFETSKLILEMVAPALDNNPRRIKQFINQFRFQRTIGKRTGLFSYDGGTAPRHMWNCKKLAKFVAISIKWPSLVSTLSSNRILLNQLQAYAQDPEAYLQAHSQSPENNCSNLEKWIYDERLVGLLRFGCVKGNPSQNVVNYTLSGLDFSKLLQISPVVVYTDDNLPLSPPEIEFVRITAGEFMMGSEEHSSEQPVHKVKIGKPFYLSKFLVTQKQWEYVMGRNPSHFKGDDLPVENVSWNDIKKFIKKLNEMGGTSKYRLPSEAEWEYACRAGTTTRYSFGNDGSKLGEYAWYGANSDGKTHPVGMKMPNQWGLYDMHGNVWELVQDKWHDSYNGAPSDGSAWEIGNGSLYVSRGGSWTDFVDSCSSLERDGYGGDNRVDFLGFRLLKEL